MRLAAPNNRPSAEPHRGITHSFFCEWQRLQPLGCVRPSAGLDAAPRQRRRLRAATLPMSVPQFRASSSGGRMC